MERESYLDTKTTLAVLDKKGGNADQAVIKALSSMRIEGSDGIGIATPYGSAVGKDAASLQNQKANSQVAIGYPFLKDRQQSTSLKDATFFFDGRFYSPTWASNAEVLAKKLRQAEFDRISEALLTEGEGAFSFIIAETERIIAGRDPVGVQPLYFGESKRFSALASNRKALWKLGVDEVLSFPPGHLAFVTQKGFKFKPVKTLVYSKPKPISMEKAAKRLQELLEQSVSKRVLGTKEVAVAFSGGLDSSIIAFLARKCEASVHLVYVSLENRSETEEAKKIADALNLPLRVFLFKEADVEKAVSRVLMLIEEADPIKASIGLPFYWTAEKTAKAGFKVLLAGQGADELFGGYQRYVNEYLSHGKEKVSRTMFDDVVKLNESNLERDMKISSFHNLELCLPFVSYQIVEFAIGLPTELKIERRAGTLRKLILRKVAENIGLPTLITAKPKKAIQYSTGVNNVLKKIAKKQKATVSKYVKNLFLSKMSEN